jgi:flagellar protein FliS
MPRPNALKQYQSVGVSSGVEGATPHRLVQMLMEGALDKVSTARGALVRGDLAEKGRHIGWAINVIGGLRASLDLEKGGEIAANLDQLYDYITRRLSEGNIQNDPAALEEVQSLLGEIKAGWDAIPVALRQLPPETRAAG